MADKYLKRFYLAIYQSAILCEHLVKRLLKYPQTKKRWILTTTTCLLPERFQRSQVRGQSNPY